jgi:hypothetical protein
MDSRAWHVFFMSALDATSNSLWNSVRITVLKPMRISFFDLPLELRDIIYSHLLYCPSGLFFSPAFSFSSPPSQHRSSYPVKGRNNALVKHETRRHSNEAWLPTSILYVSKQVHYEASEILYRQNNFIFQSPLQPISQFLTTLPLTVSSMIRHITFLKRSLMALHFDNFTAWRSLYPALQDMNLESVTVYPPLEVAMYNPHPAILFRAMFGEPNQFWWPALRFFVGLLMSSRHSLKSIRLNYPLTPTPIPAAVLSAEDLSSSPMSRTALKDQQNVNVEDLIIIQRLRVPRYADDSSEEADIYANLKASGPHGMFTRRCWKEWYERPEVVNRIKWEFDVHWESKGEGLGLRDSEGVVLELTNPGK